MSEMTDAQIKHEIAKCEYCERKPCREGCPAHCSPADFIMAIRVGSPADYVRAAGEILSRNPLGGICGAVCPDTHCMAVCSRKDIDRPVEIPSLQESIIRRAARLNGYPQFAEPKENGKRIAVIGAGPAGLAAAFTLSRFGYGVEIFEKTGKPGGALNLIPRHRLDVDVLKGDLAFVLSSKRIKLHVDTMVSDPKALKGFDAVILTVGLTEPIRLVIPGEDSAIGGWEYLTDPGKFKMQGPVAVIGGGAVALDCAVTARIRGAERVEIFSLEKWSEMPLPEKERRDLLEKGIHVNGRTRVTAISTGSKGVSGIETIRVAYSKGEKTFRDKPEKPIPFDPKAVSDLKGTEQKRADFRHVIVAIGQRSSLKAVSGVYAAGDCVTGPSTVVEAVAAGKNAAAEAHSHLSGTAYAAPDRPRKSRLTIPGWRKTPVPLETDFFGRKIPSPFLLSAAPPTDGYDQMKKGMEAGWAGGVMKTAFDNVPIHIPAEYMFSFTGRTWANCDNVSGHSLERVCREVARLVKEFPDRLVMASTGGPVTGDDAGDAKVWQSNTRKLESAGVMGIEYSLSCPQGGDGTEGDIVSQNAALTVKIIEWILKTGDPNVPKLFKLTAAVTSVGTIVTPIKALFARYPKAKAGITLANTFPTLGFRPSNKKGWDEGVIVGMSGEGVTPISNLTLAKVAGLGVTVSGNGGPMDYKAAADFLALGARSVQFCTAAMKYGYGDIDELHSGLSHLMKERGIRSVNELIGIALPKPITDFMELSAKKTVSAVHEEICVSCGNCTRCPYLAITLNAENHPMTDAAKCVGCSICAKMCISGALFMRERSAKELSALQEH
ncbi:MAG: FAD-dependent oxidoreductase [Pseudomonadota bacterium]